MFLAQGFYARRLYIVNRKYRLVVFLAVALLLLELGFSIVGTVVGFKGRSFKTLAHYSWIYATVFGLAILVDLILTGAFIAIIRQSRTEPLGTSPALVVLARYAVFASKHVPRFPDFESTR
ncbi:hypothetical protein GSI_05588 [Ganoderma sinense ZZ0214-1]|uniref:Uncharacterized protein n=1 Tax=Ganoderma sinense ZZ0214-1 TaxID=1077348 RepID=A0A2G8SEZ4_9APHY|nr:hypothetical protein GSI_05588 [Ganoderma sinense ZZ0214-1]